MRRRRLLLLGAWWPLASAAQTVYRCGPAGNVYTQQPCADGREVDVSDPRTPAQAAQARAELRSQEQWARRAAQQRLADEAANPPALAGGIGPTAAARAARERPTPAPAQRAPRRRDKGQPGKASRDRGFVAIAPDDARPGGRQR